MSASVDCYRLRATFSVVAPRLASWKLTVVEDNNGSTPAVETSSGGHDRALDVTKSLYRSGHSPDI
jgi:hypothetical protein